MGFVTNALKKRKESLPIYPNYKFFVRSFGPCVCSIFMEKQLRLYLPLSKQYLVFLLRV
jgi:hypothetical protein